MKRRTFFHSAASAAALVVAPITNVISRAEAAQTPAQPVPPETATAGRPQASEKFGASVDNLPIIDAHIHLFDGTRPQGASYMGSQAFRSQSKTMLPELYAPLARPTGIVGAIIV